MFSFTDRAVFICCLYWFGEWVSFNNWDTDILEKIIKAKTTRMMVDYIGIAKGFEIKITKKRIGDITKGKWANEILRAKTIKELVGAKQ